MCMVCGGGSFVGAVAGSWESLSFGISLDLYLNLSFGISRCDRKLVQETFTFRCLPARSLPQRLQMNRYYNLHRSSRNRIGGRPGIQSYVQSFPNEGPR